LGKSLTTGDAALNWAERIAKWIAWGVSAGVFSSIAGIVVGFLTGNPLSGLVMGVVAGMVVLVAFAWHAVRVAAASPHHKLLHLLPQGNVYSKKS
jgi:ABC-type Mn2+/Zn2+ transport system permease subunit